MGQNDSNDNKPTTSAMLFMTPSPSQCAILPPSASKSKTPKDKDFFSEFVDRAKFIKTVEMDREEWETELHRKRMDSILNEVKYLEQTDWMYPSVENILGFKDERPILLSTRYESYESAANLAEAHMFRVATGTDRNTWPFLHQMSIFVFSSFASQDRARRSDKMLRANYSNFLIRENYNENDNHVATDRDFKLCSQKSKLLRVLAHNFEKHD